MTLDQFMERIGARATGLVIEAIRKCLSTEVPDSVDVISPRIHLQNIYEGRALYPLPDGCVAINDVRILVVESADGAELISSGDRYPSGSSETGNWTAEEESTIDTTENYAFDFSTTDPTTEFLHLNSDLIEAGGLYRLTFDAYPKSGDFKVILCPNSAITHPLGYSHSLVGSEHHLADVVDGHNVVEFVAPHLADIGFRIKASDDSGELIFQNVSLKKIGQHKYVKVKPVFGDIKYDRFETQSPDVVVPDEDYLDSERG